MKIQYQSVFKHLNKVCNENSLSAGLIYIRLENKYKKKKSAIINLSKENLKEMLNEL